MDLMVRPLMDIMDLDLTALMDMDHMDQDPMDLLTDLSILIMALLLAIMDHPILWNMDLRRMQWTIMVLIPMMLLRSCHRTILALRLVEVEVVPRIWVFKDLLVLLTR
jgi:hypothetical protein